MSNTDIIMLWIVICVVIVLLGFILFGGTPDDWED